MNQAEFRIIKALLRIGIGADNPAYRHQVERLAELLTSQGESRQAAGLRDLLKSSPFENSLRPSQLIASSVKGEVLTRSTLPPVDKETGTPLAELLFPPDLPRQGPIFSLTLNHAIEAMIEEWSHAGELLKIGVSPATSCMLFGAPGTGKTRLAHYIAQQLNLPLVLANLGGLISSFLGTTARNIGALFHFANRYKCVLLLDEFDAVAKLRDDPQEVGEIKRVVNALLQNIDQRRPVGLTIATTNHENLLDPAVWRRFDVRILVPKPSAEERIKILSTYFPPVALSAPELRLLGWISEGMSGSDLESMVRTFKRYATVRQGGKLRVFEALQVFTNTSASSESNERLELPVLPPHQIARTLVRNPELQLTQQEVGEILGRDQTTISRWLKVDENVELGVVNA